MRSTRFVALAALVAVVALVGIGVITTSGGAAPPVDTAPLPVVEKGTLLEGQTVTNSAPVRVDLDTTGYRSLAVLPHAAGALIHPIKPYLNDGASLAGQGNAEFKGNAAVGGTSTLVGGATSTNLVGIEKVQIEVGGTSSTSASAAIDYVLSR